MAAQHSALIDIQLTICVYNSSMTTITFDTLKFSRKLKEAGVPEKQAEAEAQAIKEAFNQAMDAQLATKQDIFNVQKDILIIEQEIYLLKWMSASTFAGVVALLIKSFF